MLKPAALRLLAFRCAGFPGVLLVFGQLLAASPRAVADDAGSAQETRPSVVVVIGAPGEEEFGRSFLQWAELWERAALQANARLTVIGRETNSTGTDRERLQQTISNETKSVSAELWLVLLGHGTFDGREARFNLRGPDFSASELATWLAPVRRPLAVIDTSSASAPFLNKLAATNRVLITATRSGHEINYARLGQYLSEAIADPTADLDKDGQTSLLEAWLTAARRVAEFYATEGRLSTEHALLDDNGDGLGTPPDWFRGIRAYKSAKDGAVLDGLRANQFHLVRSEAEQKLPPEVRAKRDALELAISRLRDTKKQMAEDDYYAKLETLLLEMARLYEGTNNAASTQ